MRRFWVRECRRRAKAAAIQIIVQICTSELVQPLFDAGVCARDCHAVKTRVRRRAENWRIPITFAFVHLFE